VEPNQMSDLADFFAQTDAVGIAIVVILVLMSLMTWTLIVAKGIQTLIEQSRSKTFLDSLWNAPSLNEVATTLKETPDHTQDNLFAHLT